MNNETPESEEDSNGLEPDFISIDELQSFNGMSDTGGSAKMFEFTCTKRVYDPTMDGYNYHVKPVEEYSDLDFKGHTVLINDKKRVCHSFEVSEGSIIIFVAETP